MLLGGRAHSMVKTAQTLRLRSRIVAEIIKEETTQGKKTLIGRTGDPISRPGKVTRQRFVGCGAPFLRLGIMQLELNGQMAKGLFVRCPKPQYHLPELLISPIVQEPGSPLKDDKSLRGFENLRELLIARLGI